MNAEDYNLQKYSEFDNECGHNCYLTFWCRNYFSNFSTPCL